MSFDLQRIRIPKSLWRPTPAIDRDMQLLAIGDVHGRADLLVDLIDAFDSVSTDLMPTATRRKIILLGDVIDRGPWSLQTLHALFHIRDHPEVLMLMGNHEAALLNCLNGTSHPQEGWLQFGGDAFLKSLEITPPSPWEADDAFRRKLTAAIGDDVIDWLRHRPFSYTVGDYYFCHAGVRPGIALNEQLKHDLIWIRKPFLKSRRYHGKVIVHGHNVYPSICVRSNRIGIDTGAYESGVLSGLILQGDQAWSLVVRDMPSTDPKDEAATAQQRSVILCGSCI